MTSVKFHLKPFEEFRCSPTSPLLIPNPQYKLVVCWPHSMIPNPEPWIECYAADGTHLFDMGKGQLQMVMRAMEPALSEPAIGAKPRRHSGARKARRLFSERTSNE